MSDQPSKNGFIFDKSSPDATAEFLDLAKLGGVLKRQWIIVVTCIALGAVVAVGLRLTLPSKWRATATLQIGQMPLTTPTKDSIQTVLVEPPAQTVERLNQRDLEDKSLAASGLPLDESTDKNTALFRQSLKGVVVKNTNFIEISLSAYSIQDAKKYLNAVARSLIALHDLRMAPILKNVNTRVAANLTQMADAQAQRTRLQGIIASMGQPKSDGHFAPHIVAVDLLAKQEQQIQDLTTERTLLSDLLLPSNTYPTTVIDAVFVPDRPYFPKLSVFLPIGVLLGAALGIALALLRDWKKTKKTV
ncbi:Wzz/FepE/Etk N-terminal domain-containing protein [Glaciimonas sp. PCH181]|uniref:Wzz/FepE/Etk N-terminal domain-containing protein n=1 Tax=Glaciimonas sp. PCH181 TaxID=2133943 RepID=UPI000D3438D6|nr:Wzz/FepE/Etk N-terminal domain-containing protein [Glaciimonas sp. PCH181]PUA17066.1 hypothetical protein C7W93_13985 [Glaciimonas sp. PCH181]